MHWKADPVGTTWRLGGRPTIISPVVTCKSKHGFGLCRHKSMNLVVRPHTISIQLQYPVHFGIRPKTFASSSGCSKCCLATQLRTCPNITGKFRFPVIKTPDIARGTSHHVQVALHVTSHCQLKVEASNRLSRSMFWRWSIDLTFQQPSFVSKLALPMSFR